MRNVWVHGTVTVYDDDFREIHQIDVKSKILIDDDGDEDEYTAMDKARDMWEEKFKPFGIFDIDDIWA